MDLSSLLMAGMFWLFRSESELPRISDRDQQIRRLQEEQEQQAAALRRKSQEMANLLIAMERKKQTLGLIKRDVQKAIEQARHLEDKSILTPLLNINAQVSNNLDGDAILEQFEQEYDAVNNGFLKRLSSRFHNLNHSERMACVYLRKDLSTKEIASLLNLSVRGVETIRYHLRKKLGLTKEEKLSSYLSEF